MGADAPILARLEALQLARSIDGNGSWHACCPAHKDSVPSLTWKIADDGRVLLTCHAGCPTTAVVDAVGAAMSDLFPAREQIPPPAETIYDIRDAAGELQARLVRRDRPGEAKKPLWKRPSGEWGLGGRPVVSLPLYGSERLAGWSRERPVYVVEGAKVADALLAAGMQALGTVTGAATIPDDASLSVMRDWDAMLSPDNDAAGRTHMRAIAARLASVARSVRWVDPTGWADKDDVADVIAPGSSANSLHALVTSGRRLSTDPAVWADLADRVTDVPEAGESADRTDKTPDQGGSVRSVDEVDGAGASTEGDGWPEIDPLTPDAPLPPFPLDALPDWMSAMVLAVAANTETDLCMAAATALGLASVPLANRFRVAAGAWTELGIHLFVCSVADTGELKSAVFGRLDAPLRQHEREMQEEEAPGRRDRERDRKEVEARLKIAQDELKKVMKAELAGRDRDAAQDGAEDGELAGRVTAARKHLRSVQAELEADDDGQTAPYALLADDSTPEALQRQMARQDGRVGIVSAESELFLMAAGRYSDKGPNLQVYLSGFSGEPIRGDRITRDAPPVERPGLAAVISTQPIVLEEARRNPYLQRRGLLARFLYAIPESRAGTRHLTDRPDIPLAVEREYADAMLRLCRIGDAHPSAAPVELRLLGEAGRRIERWHDERLEPRRHRETGDLGSSYAMAGWAARLHGLAVRIAGVLHVAQHMQDAPGMAIEPATVDAAITIAEWAIEHAYAAFGIARLDSIGHDALRVRRWYRADPVERASFTLRAANRGLRGLDADRVRAALGRLVDHGYVRVERRKSGPAGGRPSDLVIVNPADLADR